MDHEDKGCVYTSHGPTSQGKNIVVKAAKYSLENLEGGIITFICPNRILSNQIQQNDVDGDQDTLASYKNMYGRSFQSWQEFGQATNQKRFEVPWTGTQWRGCRTSCRGTPSSS